MDGILIINKPKNFTSHDVVNVVRKQLNESKVGHTGTLDPNATGVLPILIGKATKISKYLIEHDKEYIASIKLGEKTTTGDAEGEVIEKDCNLKNIFKELNENKVKDTLNLFLGKQKQIPPIYSSIKVNGKKAYEYARKGQTIELDSRDIEIYEIELIEILENEIVFRVYCSKGTYIRTLCEEIAEKLGTVGYMKELTRTKVNNFSIENSVSIDELKSKLENVGQELISIESLFKNKRRINLNNRQKELFLNGVRLTIEEPDDIYIIYNDNKFIGLGIVKSKLLKRDVIV